MYQYGLFTPGMFKVAPPAPSLISRPSGRITRFAFIPYSPGTRDGAPVAFTTMPTGNVWAVTPRLVIVVTLWNCSSHVCLPCSSVTSTYRIGCGFLNSHYVTVPWIYTVLVRSKNVDGE